MSDRLTDKAIREHLFATNLEPVERHTLLTLAHGIIRSDPDFPLRQSYKTIAGWLGVEVRSAKYRVKKLESLGILVPTRTGGGCDQHGRGYSNQWRFDLNALKALGISDEGSLKSTPKGDTDCTLNDAIEQQARVQHNAPKGETEQHQGGNRMHEGVIPVAHNPMLPMEPMTTNEDTKPERLTIGFSDEFESWWKSYPSRPGCPKGNKSEAWGAWQKLEANQCAEVVKATANLIQSKAYPKDAQRFLRPERGSTDTEAAYESWIKIVPSRSSSHGTERAKHDEDLSWITGGKS